MIERIKNSKKLKILVNVGTALLLVMALIAGTGMTYSWISRKSSTKFATDNMVIEANNSLAFKLTDTDNSAMNAMNLADLLGVENFILKPVSNLTGESPDFFWLNKTGDRPIFQHISSPDPSVASLWANEGKTYGYIEGTFVIVCNDLREGEQRFVYLDPESFVDIATDESTDREPAASALRVSLTVAGQTWIFSKEGTTRTYIDGNGMHQPYVYRAINNASYEKTVEDTTQTIYGIHGCPYFTDDTNVERTTVFVKDNQSFDVSLPLTKTVNSFADFTGYVMDGDDPYADADGNNYIDPNLCLFKFDAQSSRGVTLRIWLEGEDALCEDPIAGTRLQLLLSFVSVTVSTTSSDIQVGDQLIQNVYAVVDRTEVNP